MEDIKSYKCPSCGSPLIFDADSQNLHCNSCDTDFSVKTMEELENASCGLSEQSKYDWETYTPRSFGENETQRLSTYTCPSCGAAVTGDDTLGATVCPYCGNSTIIKGQFEGSFCPDYVIPFKLDKKQAMKEFEKACKKAPFLPDEFKDKRKIEEMAGLYVPFWMFDCDCNANISYIGQKVRRWSDSRYNYIKTNYYKLIRSGSIGFANLPVDGSKKADNTYMEALEPYDYNDAVDFNTAYLSGFIADKYDVTAEQSVPRANERIKNSTIAEFEKTVRGYSSVVTDSSSVSFSGGKIRYSLLPVWMLNIKYKDNVYKYAINGQTGKTVGSYPVCKRKRNIYFAKVFGISAAVMTALVAAYYFFG